jgi:hypothetical protein
VNLNRDNLVLAAILIIAFLCFMLGAAIPATPEPLERWSGYEWQQMTGEQRTYYTAGLMTGLWFGARAQAAPEGSAAQDEVERFFTSVAAFLDGHDLEGAVTALERFYLVGSRNVPIVFVLVTSEDRNQ